MMQSLRGAEGGRAGAGAVHTSSRPAAGGSAITGGGRSSARGGGALAGGGEVPSVFRCRFRVPPCSVSALPRPVVAEATRRTYRSCPTNPRPRYPTLALDPCPRLLHGRFLLLCPLPSSLWFELGRGGRLPL